MDVLGIEIRKDAWAVAHVKSSLFGVRFQSYFLLNGDDAHRRIEELKGYISDKGLKGARTALVLPRESAMTGVLRIPAPGADAVEGVLKFELEKHIPFAPEETLRSFHILKNDRNIFSVLFAAAGREAVDSAVKMFIGSGIEPSCVAPWQTSLYNALYGKGAVRAGRNIAFIWIGAEEIRLEAFESMCPAYSRTLRRSGGKELWTEEVKKELKGYLTRAGSHERRLDECVVIDGSGHARDDEGVASFLSSELGLPVEVLRLKDRAPGAAAPAIGAALTALGSSRLEIDFEGGSRSLALKAERRTLALGLVAVLLLVFTGASYPVKDWIAERSLAYAISGAEAEKGQAEALVVKLKSAEERIAALEEIEGSTAGVLDSLRELTEIIPGDTYLTGFEYNGAAKHAIVTIEGVSGRASSVLLRMERSERINGPEFAGPVVKATGGKERFRMSFAFAGPLKKEGR